jgi:transglutaminase-like putative cysteine protease
MGLKKGQKIKSRGNGYALVIPNSSEPLVQNFYQEALTYAGNTAGKQRIGRFVDFVYKSIKGEENWEKGLEEVSLLSSLGLRKGVCKEKAALLSIILSLDGIESDYKRGLVPDENDEMKRHAWLKVKFDNEFWLTDPSYGPRFGKYESATRMGKYSEDGNFLERALEKLIKRK